MEGVKIDDTNEKIHALIANAFDSPEKVSPEDISIVYDRIYSYCSDNSENTFSLKGSDFYEQLKTSIQSQTKNISFHGIEDIYGIFTNMEKATLILCSAFRYLDRFYIKYNKKQTIREILYQGFFYAFLKRNKSQLFNTFILEMRTNRLSTQNEEKCRFLGCLSYCLTFYIDFLRQSGETKDLQEFFDLYLKSVEHDFMRVLNEISMKSPNLTINENKINYGNISSKDLNTYINLVYNEIHFAYTSVDKFLCKNVINLIGPMHEMLIQIFKGKLMKGKNVKPLYAILVFLNDDRRKEIQQIIMKYVKAAYSKVGDGLQFINIFGEISKYLSTNRIKGIESFFKTETLKFYREKATSLNIDKVLIEKMHFYIKENGERISETFSKDNCNLDILFGDAFDVYLQILEICFNDDLQNEYVHCCQLRLLEGIDPSVEETLLNLISNRIEKISSLHRSIESYKNKIKLGPKGSLAIITDYFWEFNKPQEPLLHESIRYKIEGLFLKQQAACNNRLNIKLRSNLSKVCYRIGNFEIISDMSCYNLLLYIFDGISKMLELKTATNMPDVSFYHSLSLLETHGILKIKNNSIKLLDYTTPCSLNLYDPSQSAPENEETASTQEQRNFYKNQCKIMKTMKIAKKMPKEEFETTFKEMEDMSGVLAELIKKEFLRENEEFVEYI